ncbi:hypothetical protein J7T55_006920 [Diaporthe amygdali]|uniref:uncharacterized protein n=1 Tax=Phomopsis amygdali TaxID=1214568 RepID=UPI0022FE4934|nr:uncharacterized protein J7T55_006920 [Diaporthe amygdali]KAJ0107042.1 hypothetical protein J7T55_006920 [Diaporthe amygdali]
MTGGRIRHWTSRTGRASAVDRLNRASLRASASENRLCCAVLLGLLSHADGGGHERIQLSDDVDSWVRLDDCEGWGAHTDMGHLFKLFASTSRTPPPGVPVFAPDDPPPTDTERTKYAALSYCWGKYETWPLCRTTRENLFNHLGGIRPEELPLALSDAVVATRRLGLEYLWIDSLCIIQDDEKDWQIKSLQMATVYTHAYVTLFAAHAANTDTGIFCHREKESLTHILTIRFRGESYPIWAFHVPQESGRIEPRLLADIWRGSLERSLEYPIFNRAWAFQERLASRRVLFFGKEELIMECASGCVFEESIYRMQPPRLSDKTLKEAYADGMTSSRKTWWEIVFTYSHLKLTVPTDRLSAIAAVAQRLAQHNPTDEYLCGLWRKSFLSDLLWERVLNNLDRGIAPIIVARWGPESYVLPYVAPSWSWISFRSKARNISHIIEPLSTVLDIHLDYRDHSKFGRVSGGFAKIQGPVVDLNWQVRAHWYYSQFIDSEQEMTLADNPDQKAAFSVDYDFYSGVRAPSPGWRVRVRCLLIGFDEDGSIGAVILFRIGQTDRYWRLGIVHGSLTLTDRDSIDWRAVLDLHSRIETCIIQ